MTFVQQYLPSNTAGPAELVEASFDGKRYVSRCTVDLIVDEMSS
jgi:hypothetical protein